MAEGAHVGYNLWSPDSRALYFLIDTADHSTYWRLAVGKQTAVKIADLPDERAIYWPLLAPDGGILYTRDLRKSEIYAVHLSEK